MNEGYNPFENNLDLYNKEIEKNSPEKIEIEEPNDFSHKFKKTLSHTSYRGARRFSERK